MLPSREGDGIVYSDEVFHLNISMISLFTKNVHVKQAVLQDLLIDIHRDDGGALRIGSYRLSPGEKQQTNGEPSPWTMQAEEIDLRNITINYRQNGVDLQLFIDNGSARGLFGSSTDEETSRITLSGHLNGAPLEIELSGFLLEPFFSISGELKLSDFSLQELEGLFQEQLAALSGTISTDGSFALETNEKKHTSWHFTGTMESRETAIRTGDWSASGDLRWNGKISQQKLLAEQMEMEMNGLFTARSLRYTETRRIARCRRAVLFCRR